MFKEGSFLRCYEVSAWLCHHFISEYKVTHRHIKGIDQSIAFVGFPLSNLEKYTTNGATIEHISDKHLVMQFPTDADKTIEEMQNEFATWKSLQPLTPGKSETEIGSLAAKKSFENPHKVGGTKSLFEIARMLVSFPVESHSPIECMNFLTDVKSELAKII